MAPAELITDAHNHLQRFPGATLGHYGVDRAAACGTSPADWEAVLELAARDPAVTPALGLHPWFLAAAPEGWLAGLRHHLEAHPSAAVGEIGLDRTRRSPPLVEQLPALGQQLDLAVQLERPCILHCVRAYGGLLDALAGRPLPPRGLLLHAFAGAAEMVPRFAALPAPVYFSISSPELLPHIPPGRLLVESDASPDNGRSPADVVAFYRAHDIEPDRVAQNYLALFPD